jgi:hypothetical protein
MPAAAIDDSRERPIRIQRDIRHFAFDNGEPGLLSQERLHGEAIEVPVHLRAWTTDSRALAAVQHLEVDSSPVRRRRHHPIQGIDLPNEVTFADSANGRIAGERTDRLDPMGEQKGARPHASGRRSSLASGMATADHHDIEVTLLWHE